MEALGINLGYLITQILGITILLLLMVGMVYKPILRVLDERKARIAKGLEDARQAAIARDNADAEAKTILDAARVDAAKIRAEAANQAEETAAGIVSKAHEDARDIKANARADAEAERNRILSELRGQVASISIAAANKLVGESLDEQRQHALVQNFFAKVPAEVTRLKGTSAEITSALPLTADEQSAAKRSIGVENVAFKVDPKILGGLVVRVGDQVVDDSVAGQMSTLRDSLN
ncbi:MAG: F0F1 ATP synthase subunit B [Anaerolineae bacterium]|nr:F0F1 ATP synthase subunit B [Anaerolineae bacterium]MCO5192208.1 F0F1 ATP synthase subunit B [Anaerolineae bacterium]MCO5198358.1 F0F1 ATP synthase subunit B [Anaerolineae bacterium]